MERTKTLSATKLRDGRIATTVDGSGDDILEMLAMLHRSVVMLMLEAETPLPVVEEALRDVMDVGVKMAVDDRKGGN